MADYKVLIPLDGSRLAERSLTYLPALKHIGDLKIELVCVVDEPEHESDEAATREQNVLTTYLHEVSSDIHKHLGITVATKLLRGAPAACLIEEAAQTQPDLLIISTHGRSGVARWRFGSVADKVIRGAACPTLIVGPHAADNAKWLEAELVAPFASLLVPLDGSPLAEQALPVAQLFAERFGSNVHYVRVVSIIPMDAGLGYESSYTPAVMDALEIGAREYLDDVAGRYKAGKTVTSEVLIGPPATALQDYADRHSIDLVIMTTHGRGGIVRAALGSVTDRLLGGEAPVLIVRPSAPHA